MTDGGRATDPGDYLRLLRQYLAGGLAGRDFCVAWNRLNSNERTLHGEPLGRLLSEFFVVVERFEPDPAVLADLQAEEPGVYIGEEEFKPLAARFLRDLEGALRDGAV